MEDTNKTASGKSANNQNYMMTLEEFQRLAREILQNAKSDVQFDDEAIKALHEHCEAYIKNFVETNSMETKPKERKTPKKPYYEGLEYLEYDSDALVIDYNSDEE